MDLFYHWREKAHENSELLAYEGSSYLGHEAHGVYLTQSGEDPNVDWNSDIFQYQRPIRYTIDRSKLDPDMFTADLNSLLGDNGESWAFEQGIDLEDPVNQTWENSLKATGNIHYQGSIPKEAIMAIDEFQAPRKWIDEDLYQDLYGEDAYTDLRQTYEKQDQEFLHTPRKIQFSDPHVPQTEGYVYHITNQERAEDIVMEGAMNTFLPDDFTEQDTWPDGSIKPRAYFAQTTDIHHFAPEDGDPVMLRMARTSDLKRDGMTPDLYVDNPVNIDKLEIYCNGGWKPIDTMHIARPDLNSVQPKVQTAAPRLDLGQF